MCDSNEQPIKRIDQRTRRSWDYIIAAHYYYENDTGYRSIARKFRMPLSTIRGIIKRTPKAEPGVWEAAIDFGLKRIFV